MKKILVIDDEVDFCNFIKSGLMVFDYVVEICIDSKKAMALIREDPPDLILLDIGMPGMSGDTLAGQLRNFDDTKKIPLIFISVLIDEKSIGSRDNTFGRQYILPKPIKIEELRKVVKTALGE